MAKIEKPRVFISYCWSNQKYIDRVVEFAMRLRGDGVDVVLDQFHMKLGNDMNNFMEKCVNDSTITNVLILLSPDYKKKADSRTGGAGKETQIISGEVYSNVENTKFIPVLFEKRGEEVDSCIPTYLKQRRWIDLSEDSNYEEGYFELVKALYGNEKYIENPLGTKPEWVDESKPMNTESQIIVNTFKANKKEIGGKRALTISFNQLLDSFTKISENIEYFDFYNASEFEKNYSLFDSFKIPYLAFLSEIKYNDDVENALHGFFVDVLKVTNDMKTSKQSFFSLAKIVLHELFIETIALLLASKNYQSIFYLTNTPYISVGNYSASTELMYFKDAFYCLTYNNLYNVSENLGRELHQDKAKGAYYYSGFSEYWRRHIQAKYLSFNEFIDADCLLTNISISLTGDYWFALSHCYLNDNNMSFIKRIALSLKSKSLSKDFYTLFGWENEEDIKKSIEALNKYSTNNELRLTYSGRFYGIPLISDYLKKDDVCKQN